MPNLYQSQNPSNQEEFVTLLHSQAWRLEQIMSHGQASPPGFWYDQAEAEWVALLQGTAILEIANQGLVNLVAGDYLLLPAHCRHRVVETSENAIWLALHFSPSS
ncbi:cupin domain-containing protein [Synechococcus sp. PCC 6312]|uniref:cupin domain-containing protein n=1 Tax=Synechococcus sp. (strain ATCC 27167 / PCC 6312) TaxID=195253 RepID=UPI00029ECB85|nr:cupin domain-containing protein [Synechococcus sp. PCC 6312]AFY60972.1 cupin domain-containing protein [Synechococcus sp. PCC 6312]